MIDAGYYVYRIDPQNSSMGWQLNLTAGKAEVNQTRGQAMKKEWGKQHQVSFNIVLQLIHSAAQDRLTHTHTHTHTCHACIRTSTLT